MAFWDRRPSGLVASAEPVKLNKDGSSNLKPLTDWQRQAWNHYNTVGEIWFATNYIANALRRVRLYPAIQPDPMQPPIPLDEGPAAAQAAAEMDKLKDVDGSHGTIVHDMAMQLSIPGEGYFTVYEDPMDPDGEVIKVFSTMELTRSVDKTWTLQDETGRPEPLPDQEPLVSRFWRQHPQFSRRPDSPMKAVGALLRELLLLDQLYRSNERSRIAAGLLLVPNEVNFRSQIKPGMNADHGQGPIRDPFVDAVMNALTTPVADEESAGNVVPGVIKVDSKFIESFRHLTFAKEFDASTAERYDKVLKRVATGLDIPNSVITGVEDLNHWSAWLVDEDAFDKHLAPLTQLICSALTQVFLKPALGDTADDIFVWFDPSALITHPNKSKDAKDAYDRGVISAEAYRRYVGYSEDDAPGGAAGPPPEAPEETPLPVPPPPEPVSTPTPSSGEQGPPNDSIPNESPEDQASASRLPLTAAASRPRGRRLSELLIKRERALRARIQVILERVIAESLAADAFFSENEMEALAAVAPALEIELAKAQGNLRELMEEYGVDTTYLQGLEIRQEDSRKRAVTLGIALLVTFLSDRLNNKNVFSEQRGEVPENLSVPPGIARQIMAVAGGAPSAEPNSITGIPVGGVWTGSDARDMLDRANERQVGWQWVYGAGGRKHPFHGHLQLDGLEFTSFDDDALRILPSDSWLNVSHYRPNDHKGCLCDVMPILEGSEERVPVGV